MFKLKQGAFLRVEPLSPQCSQLLASVCTALMLAFCLGHAERCRLCGMVQLWFCVIRLPEAVSINVVNYCIMNNTSLRKPHL